MSTYREIIYLVLDEVKLHSDDATFTEDHVLFIINKYRSFLIKQKFENLKKEISESNYQEICLDLIEVPAISGEPCEGGSYLRSKNKIPTLIPVGNPMVYPTDYYQGIIVFVPRERMRYIGHNKYMDNIIYCSIAPDSYLYFKSNNPQFLYLEKVRMLGIFEDAITASQLNCTDENECDVMDLAFPLEDALVPLLIELATKELVGVVYRPKDQRNNADDDLDEIAGKE